MWCRFFLYVVLLAIIGCTEAVVQLPPNVTVPAIIVFGDSIVDQGTNNNLKTLAKCNFPPYGQDFNGGVATGRFSNGRTPPDMIASELGIKELVPAYSDPNLQSTDLLTGVSFASGGSGYDPQTPKLLSALSFPDQLEMFKEYIIKVKALVGEERTNYILANTVYLIVAASNDIATTYFTVGFRKSQYDVASYADLLVDSASTFVQDIYELGARRMAIFGAPPLGCLPSQRTLAGGVYRVCADKYNEAAQLYNTKLSSKLHSFGNSLPQSKLVYIDIYNPLFDIIQNPQNYGIDVVDSGCCGSGKIEVVVLCNKFSPTCPDDSKFLFWDSFHPTETGYNILVDQIITKNVNSFF